MMQGTMSLKFTVLQVGSKLVDIEGGLLYPNRTAKGPEF